MSAKSITKGEEMKRLALCCALTLAGCAAVPTPVQMTSSFNADEVAWSSKVGTASVTGNAVLRTVGGDAKTCAAQQVNLIPDSAYARERLMSLIGSLDGGFMLAASHPNFATTDPAYAASVRQSRCDAQGNFVFDHLPAGKYYLTAEVTWGIPQRYVTSVEGGLIMQPVTLADGESRHIVLTR